MQEEQLILFLHYAPGILFSLIMGLGFGTFCTLAVYRLPRGMDWIGKDTRCLSCNHKLYLKDFFPIISLLLTKGKCRYCNAPIELQGIYLFTEAAITLLCVLTFLFFGFGDLYLLITALCITLVVIAAIDIDSNTIPNKPLIVLMTLGCMYRTLIDGHIFSIIEGATLATITALAIRATYFTAKGQKEKVLDFIGYEERDHFAGEGFDYVKLTAIIGLWLGAEGFLYFIPLALLTLLLAPLVKHINKSNRYHLALPLSVAMLLQIFLSPIIMIIP